MEDTFGGVESDQSVVAGTTRTPTPRSQGRSRTPKISPAVSSFPHHSPRLPPTNLFPGDPRATAATLVPRTWLRVRSPTTGSIAPLEMPLELEGAGPSAASKSQLKRCVDGNTAAAYVAYAMSELAIIYPITPSNLMGELVEEWSAYRKANLLDQVVQVTTMQSEAGLAGALHGALSGGSLATTFTSSQGLLLMIPNLYKIAGELLPCVIHCATRSLSTYGLSIFGDHSDVMAVRQTGWALLCASAVQEVMDLGVIAHTATLESSIPFCHFFDGFRISHEMNTIEMVDYDTMRKMTDVNLIHAFRARSLNPENPYMKGTSMRPDIFFQLAEASNLFYGAVPDIVEQQMQTLAQMTGREYHVFDYHGHPAADRVVVVMGSAKGPIVECVDFLCGNGEKVGLVIVRLFRPFSDKHFLQALPESVRRIAVLDRTKEPGSLGEPLYLDVSTAIQSSERRGLVHVFGGRYGLASKDFNPTHALAAFENLQNPQPKNHFTVGILDDITGTSLPVSLCIDLIAKDVTQCILWGKGQDGTVGSAKHIIQILGEHTSLFAQGYFSYDAHKAGAVTTSHLRFGPRKIRSHYLVMNADYIACSQDVYMGKYEVLNNIKQGGIFLLNTAWTDAQIETEVPGPVKRMLARRHVQFYVVNASKIAVDEGLPGRVNMIMTTLFFALIPNLLTRERYVPYLKDTIQRVYMRKGEDVVKKNWVLVDKAHDAIRKVNYPAAWEDMDGEWPIQLATDAPSFVREVLLPVSLLKGDELPVSKFTPGGVMPIGTTKFEKRAVASAIPVWRRDDCSQCNECAFSCPHAAIRPYLLDENQAKNAPRTFKSIRAAGIGGEKKHRFRVQVSPRDCTGCGVCVQVCEDNALELRPIEDVMSVESANYEFALKLPSLDPDLVPKNTVKGSQFQPPLLEFSGACAGCGETPYVKLVTQLFGDQLIIANATGCSSIWGGSAPFSAYTVNSQGHGPAWANSLFEDNAEYGLGIHLAYFQRRKKLVRYVEQALHLPSDLIQEDLKKELSMWLECRDNRAKSRVAAQRIKVLLCGSGFGGAPAGVALDVHPYLRAIYRHKDLLAKKSMWMIGGDGWAYDIGFGGIDHVIAMGEDVNILVLDTESYSNNSGVMSKATPRGAIAKYATLGKGTKKKDLGRLAMTYGHVYVASVAIGADKNQLVKALYEAEHYNGPSLIIAYSACIEHGIKGGMSHSHKQMKRAVESGYWTLYRYNPTRLKRGKNPLIMDSGQPRGELADLLTNEVRFSSLTLSHPQQAQKKHDHLALDIAERQRQYGALDSLYRRKVPSASPSPSSSDSDDLLDDSFTAGDWNGVQEEAGAKLPIAYEDSPRIVVGTAPLVEPRPNLVRSPDTAELVIPVLFGTGTGNSEEVAKRIARHLQRMKIRSLVKVLNDVAVRELARYKCMILVCSTYGKLGRFPDNALSFWSRLSEVSLLSDTLAHTKHAVFGLGDSSYERFNEAAKLLSRRLCELGSTPLVPLGLGDDQDTGGFRTKLKPWLKELFAAVRVFRGEEEQFTQEKQQEPLRFTPSAHKASVLDLEDMLKEEDEDEEEDIIPRIDPLCDRDYMAIQGRFHSYESFSTTEGDGIRFLIFLQGCPLRCLFCSNPDTWDPTEGKAMTVGELIQQVRKCLPYLKPSGGGITCSGGEPLMQPEFCGAIFKAAKEMGLTTVLETTGYARTSNWHLVLPYTDTVLLCTKQAGAEGYRRITGRGNVRRMYAFLKTVAAYQIPIWFRYVVVPGYTDSEDALTGLIRLVKNQPNVERVELLPYHTLGVHKWEMLNLSYPLEGVPTPSKEVTQKMADRLRAEGFNVVW